MLERKPGFVDLPHQLQRERALLRSESKGGTGLDRDLHGPMADLVQTDVDGAAQMISLVERACHFRELPLS
jgi:hypothetical protein